MARAREAEMFAAFDRLEQRMVLSGVEIAAVGFTYSTDMNQPVIYEKLRSYTLEGTVSESDVMSYRLFWDSQTGARPGSPVRHAPMRLQDDGSFDYESPRWSGGSLFEEGGQFLPQDGYGAGWWRARTTAYEEVFPIQYVTHAEEQLIVPRAAADTPLGEVAGTWAFAIRQRRLSDGSETIITGTISINSAIGLVSWSFDEGSLPYQEAHITGGTGSKFTTDRGQTFYLSADGSTLIFADTARQDGLIHMGMAIRADQGVSAEEAAGTYRVMSNAGTNRTDASDLTLNADGTFVYSSGGLSMSIGGASGTWFIHDNMEIVLRPSDGEPEDRFVLSAGGGTLLLVATARPEMFAIGTRQVGEPMRHDPVLAAPSIGAMGESLIFIDRSNGPWTVVDFAAESGGPEATGEVVAWFDGVTGLARAAAVTDQGVVVYSEQPGGDWTFVVLADELGTAMVTGGLAHTPGPGGRMNLFGLTADGDLVRYVEGLVGAGWAAWNLSALRLDPYGLSTPDFAGNLVAYATPWGGLNIAGLDGIGRLQTVWTTPKAAAAGRWFVSDLSAITGSPIFTGTLGVANGGRNGIHYTAANASGGLEIISWKPGGTWTKLDFAPPAFDFGGVMATTYDRSTQGVYIAFVPEGETDVYLYTFPTALSPLPTFAVNVTSTADPAEMLLGGLSLHTGPDGLISVLGRNSEGETLRYTSEWSLVSDWTLENLTEIAG